MLLKATLLKDMAVSANKTTTRSLFNGGTDKAKATVLVTVATVLVTVATVLVTVAAAMAARVDKHSIKLPKSLPPSPRQPKRLLRKSR